METERLDIWPLPAYRTVLPNGFTIITMPDDSGLVDVEVVIGAGEWHADPLGTAHLLEHLIAGGETTLQHPRVQELVARDSVASASTGIASTSYSIARNFATDLHHALEALFSMVYRDGFSESKIERERTIVLREMQQKYPPNKLELRSFELHIAGGNENLLRGPHGGSTESIPRITSADLRRMRDSWYTAGNSLLIVCGTANHDDVVQQMLQYSTYLTRGAKGHVQPLNAVNAGHYVFKSSSVQTGVWVYSPAPIWPHPDHFAHRAFCHLLKSPDNELIDALRVQRGLIYSMRVEAMGQPLCVNQLFFPCEQVAQPEVERITRDFLNGLAINSQSTAPILQRWQTGFSKQLLEERCNKNARTQANAIRGRWLEDDWNQYDREHLVMSVATDNLARVARDWFDPAKSAWVHAIRS